MPPPQLARDAPGLDVFHPFEIGLLPIARHEHGAPVAHRRDRGCGKRLGVDVPLVGEERFDHHARAVAVRHHVRVRLGLGEQACRLHAPHDVLAHDEAVAAVIRQRLRELWRGRNIAKKCLVAFETELGLDVEHVDQRQIVAPSHLEVVEIVRGRNLDRTGTFLRIGIFIGDDRDAASDQRQDGIAPHEVPVARVVRMHGDGRVAEHGLGARGRDRDEGVVEPFDRILEMPQLPLHLDLLHFEVGDGGQQLGVPVDQPLVLVDEALPVELHEHLEHRARKSLVHGEAFARPVAGGTQALELLDDGAARFRLPRPHLFEEFFAPERAPAGLLALHELALDHHLGGDAGVIGAGLPQHVAAAHALEAHQHVLEGVVERMAHMQRAGDVGRRDDDGIRPGIAPFRPAAAKCARLLPRGVDAPLNGGGLVCLVDHCCFGPAISR